MPQKSCCTKDLTQETDWRGVILHVWVEKHTAQTSHDGGHYRCNGACTLGTLAKVEACHISEDRGHWHSVFESEEPSSGMDIVLSWLILTVFTVG